MGTVWAATHVVTRRSVAMKFLRQAVAHKTDLRQRFLREAQAASALRHPNVVEVIDVFDLPDRSPVIVMELLEGETLGEKLVRDERLSMEETAAVMLPVVAAVGAAHANGIVHRDLKPENVFLSRIEDGINVKVLDFGIAKLLGEQYHEQGQSVLVTESGSLLGTPCYMAPEQMGNADVDYRADIWSLGVILYECLSGTRPIEGQNMAEVLARLIGDAIVPLDRLAPELPHDVTALVQQMLARDPNRRLQNLAELTKVLGRFARLPVPSFGPPRSAMASADGAPPVRRASVPPRADSAAASATPRRTSTMMSAPAVGIDGRRSAALTPSSNESDSVRRLRIWLPVAIGVAIALGASLWFGPSRQGPAPAAPSLAAPSVTATPAPPPPPVEPSPKPTAEARTDPAPAPSGHPPKTARPGHVMPGGAAKATRPGGSPASEDSLFSGRK